MQRSTVTNTNTNPNTSAASQACAVCRYQRKKCTQNCPLAPFFPASNHKDFLNTRKLFGVRNITKLMENLNPQQRVIAIKSMIFEANVRAKDPVGGCYRIISELQRLIDWNRAELELVRYQLSICKANKEQELSEQNQMVQVVADDDDDDDDQGLEGFNGYDTMPVDDQHCLEEKGNCSHSSYGGSSSLSSVHNLFDPSLVKVEPEAPVVPVLYKQALSDVGEDIKPLLAAFGDKGSVALPFDSKEYSSDKLVPKEEIGSIQHELKHDLKLKGAASLFTITNDKG
ncbi:hypothetical protein PTKIN_Ptkin19aG0102600 [Pterospermum kingtungense]